MPDGLALQLYRVIAMPTTVFITPDGHVLRKVSGAISARGLNAHLDELIRVSKAVPAS